MSLPVENQSDPAKHRWQRLAPLIASGLLALVVYGVTISGTYVYDDVLVAHNDPRLTQPSLWREYWTRPYMAAPDKLYRPLVSLSFAAQRVLWGDGAWQFHLVNILLHAAVAAAVAELGFRLAGIRTAWFAGPLFAIHPVHVEAVAAIVGRSESACALATLFGLYAFLGRPMTAGRVAFISASCALAVLCKEQGMLFPLLLLALWPVRAGKGVAGGERRPLRLLIASICYITAGYVLLREYTVGFWWDRVFLEWVMNPLVRSHGIDRLLMPLVLVGRYLVLLVAPHRQSLDYGGTDIGWTANPHDPYLYLGALAVVAWIAFAVWALRTRRWAVLFCLLAFALTYGMVGNMVALIGTIFAERLMYLPSAFFLLLIGMALARAPARVGAGIVSVLVVAGGLAAFSYARLWDHPEALYRACVQHQPGAERPYDLLFGRLASRRDWNEARSVALTSIRIIPESDRPYAMAIEADLALGRKQEAWSTYLRGMGACRGFEKLYLLPYSKKITDAPGTRPAG